MTPSRREILLFGPAALLAGPASAQPAPTDLLYLAHLNPNNADNPTGAMAITFKAEVERAIANRLRVEIFPDGQLGPESGVVELVRKGIIQSAIVSVGGMSRSYPQIGVLNYPFRFHDLNEAYRVFDSPFGRRLGDDIKARTGLTVLGYGDTGGLFVMTNSRQAIHEPGDMTGLSIRTMDLDSHKAFVQSLGATPVVIDWSELYGSLQNGTVLGQMNPASIIVAGGLDRVQGYLTVTNHLYTPYIWIANTAWLEARSDDERAAIAAAARLAVEASRRLAANDTALKLLSDSLQVYQPTEAELAEFREAAQPAVERLIEETLGADAVALLEAFRRD
jgi:tripartite ATP-independent transporter DctP family solute receptor